MQILKWPPQSVTMTKKSNFFTKHLMFMNGTTYQTVQSGGGPLCKMGQASAHESVEILKSIVEFTLLLCGIVV